MLLGAFCLSFATLAVGACSSLPGPAKTERERRINIGADPSAVRGKQAGGLMDSGIVPAPAGVRTGIEGGLKAGHPTRR